MGVLPKSLLKEFASINNDKKEPKKEEYVYGTASVNEDSITVHIDGATGISTPATTTVDVTDGDRVACMLKDRQLVVMGNLTNNATTFQRLSDPDSKTVIDGGLIKTGCIQSANGDFFVDLQTGETKLANATFTGGSSLDGGLIKTGKIESIDSRFSLDLNTGEVNMYMGNFGGLTLKPFITKQFKMSSFTGDWDEGELFKSTPHRYPANAEQTIIHEVTNYSDMVVILHTSTNNAKIRIEPGETIEDATIFGEFNGHLFIRCTTEDGLKFDCYGNHTGQTGYISANGFIGGSIEWNVLNNGFNGGFFTDNIYVKNEWYPLQLEPGWKNGTLSNGNAAESEFPRITKIGRHVYIQGSVGKSSDAEEIDMTKSVKVASIGTVRGNAGDRTFFLPEHERYAITPATGNRFAKVCINRDGDIFVDWVVRFVVADDGSLKLNKVTKVPNMIDITLDYWVDNYDD